MQNDKNSKPRFPGTRLTLGGADYVVPPLSFRQLRDLAPQIDDLVRAGASGALTSLQFDPIIEVVHASLSRNYPDITKDEVGDLIDLGNVKTIIEAVLSASGFVRASEQGGEETGPLTGTESTLIS